MRGPPEIDRVNAAASYSASYKRRKEPLQPRPDNKMPENGAASDFRRPPWSSPMSTCNSISAFAEVFRLYILAYEHSISSHVERIRKEIKRIQNQELFYREQNFHTIETTHSSGE